MRVFVIIPAAGLGTRMSSAVAARGEKPPDRSKQFLELGGVPIVTHTLRKFANHPGISDIVLAMRPSEVDAFRPELEGESFAKRVRIVSGGEHRQDSVANALGALNASDDDIVLVHDAVRPFVDAETITAVIEGAEKYGAVIAGVPAIDTIKQVERTADGAVISATIPREHIVQAQTPQGFRFGLLKKLFDEARADGFYGTDEASLLERAGHEVHVVMGSPKNIKITTPADLELAEFYASLENGPKANLVG